MIDIDGEPWFPAKDVCDALGIKNPRSAVGNSCAPHQSMQIAKSNVANSDISFPNRGMLAVSQGGLFKLLFVSRKPMALEFQDWVTDVVLPSIRKNGGYIKDQEKVATGEMTKAELA